jgi:hypothetical protein
MKFLLKENKLYKKRSRLGMYLDEEEGIFLKKSELKLNE